MIVEEATPVLLDEGLSHLAPPPIDVEELTCVL